MLLTAEMTKWLIIVMEPSDNTSGQDCAVAVAVVIAVASCGHINHACHGYFMPKGRIL